MTNLEKLFHRYYIIIENREQLEWTFSLLESMEVYKPFVSAPLDLDSYDYENRGELCLYDNGDTTIESYFEAKDDYPELFKKLSVLELGKVESAMKNLPHTLYEFRDIRWDADKTHVYKYTYVGEDPTSYGGEVVVLNDIRKPVVLRKEKWESLKNSTYKSAQQKRAQEAKEWVTYLKENIKD